MKESVGSLRAFFIIVGLLGLMGNGLGILGSLVLLAVKPVWGILSMLVMGPGLLVSLGYIYCGAALPSLLQKSPGQVQTLILARMVLAVLGVGVVAMLGGVTTTVILQAAFAIGISYYLLSSVKRLSGQGF